MWLRLKPYLCFCEDACKRLCGSLQRGLPQNLPWTPSLLQFLSVLSSLCISPLTLDAIVTCLTLTSGSVWKHFKSSSFTLQRSSLNGDRMWCHSIRPLDKPINAFSSNYSIVPTCEWPKMNIFSPVNPSGQCDTIVLLTFYICNLSADNLFYRKIFNSKSL